MEEEDVHEYRRYFDLVDINGSGQIDRNQYTELILLLHQRGHMGDKEAMPKGIEIKRMFDDIDKDRNGVVVFDEFCRQLYEVATETPIEALAQLAFEILDKNGDAHISAKEISGFLNLSVGTGESGQGGTIDQSKLKEMVDNDAALMIEEAEVYFNGDIEGRCFGRRHLEGLGVRLALLFVLRCRQNWWTF